MKKLWQIRGTLSDRRRSVFRIRSELINFRLAYVADICWATFVSNILYNKAYILYFCKLGVSHWIGSY